MCSFTYDYGKESQVQAISHARLSLLLFQEDKVVLNGDVEGSEWMKLSFIRRSLC